jgi:hypothetical protein
MTNYNIQSWRDDFDLEPNTHPTIAYALQSLRTAHAARLANEQAKPKEPQPVENKA